MAAEDIENPDSADGADGNPNKGAKAAAATAKPSQHSRHPVMTCISVSGFLISMVVYVASMTLFAINCNSPSHPTRAVGIAVGLIGMVAALGLFVALTVQLSYI
jgi:hypothetical protein